MKKILLLSCCFITSVNYAQTTSVLAKNVIHVNKNAQEIKNTPASFPEFAVDSMDNLYIVDTTISLDKSPTEGVFFVNSNTKTKQTLQLYDPDGNLTLNQTTSGKAILDPSNLKKGIYNLTIKNNSDKINKKIIIIVR